MLRIIFAVIAGFLLWGALCVPANAVVAAVFPERFEADGGTFDALMCLLLIAMSVGYSIASGYLVAAIGREDARRAVWGLAIVNLCFGIFVEVSYWNSLPVWYHLVFLALLIPGILLGGKLRMRRAPAVGESTATA